ncbi:MAG: hypothetical protein KKD44_01275, partial [Proteobacteria bacterium]|nr:hypothetical protein [Pseudomonadota bacterium]
MTYLLPDLVNKRRRISLFRYSLIAMFSYQFPVGIAYLIILSNHAKYDYAVINNVYAGYMTCSITAMIWTLFKKQITTRFISLILYYQVYFCLFVSAYFVYVMSDQRYLVPVGSMLILTFVFIQSGLIASFFVILVNVALYFLASYIGIKYSGQPGSMAKEILYISTYVPVCIFIAFICKTIQDQQKKIKKANSKLKATHA